MLEFWRGVFLELFGEDDVVNLCREMMWTHLWELPQDRDFPEDLFEAIGVVKLTGNTFDSNDDCIRTSLGFDDLTVGSLADDLLQFVLFGYGFPAWAEFADLITLIVFLHFYV